MLERALEVAEGDALVDHQALDLRELRQVRGVGDVAAVDLARRQDVDGRLLRLHGAHLHRGGLRAKKDVGLAGHRGGLPGEVADVEGVGRRARRVVRRRVQSGEVVVVQLDVGSLGHLVAEADEDPDDLVDGAGDQVRGPGRAAATREGDVDGVGQHAGVEGLRAQVGLASRERRFQRLAHLVGHLAHGGPLLG